MTLREVIDVARAEGRWATCISWSGRGFVWFGGARPLFATKMSGWETSDWVPTVDDLTGTDWRVVP